MRQRVSLEKNLVKSIEKNLMIKLARPFKFRRLTFFYFGGIDIVFQGLLFRFREPFWRFFPTSNQFVPGSGRIYREFLGL